MPENESLEQLPSRKKKEGRTSSNFDLLRKISESQDPDLFLDHAKTTSSADGKNNFDYLRRVKSQADAFAQLEGTQRSPYDGNISTYKLLNPSESKEIRRGHERDGSVPDRIARDGQESIENMEKSKS
jgi:hypothetical protein